MPQNSGNGVPRAAKTCRHFNIFRKLFYTWQKRYAPLNPGSLENRSTAAKNARQREITPQQETRIVTLKRAMTAGAS